MQADRQAGGETAGSAVLTVSYTDTGVRRQMGPETV